MRQIVLDTETTGLAPNDGHRIIEIGCIELLDRRPTNNRFHEYLNPDRTIDPGAVEVHGLTTEFLQGKPRFDEVVADFIEYIRGAELIIHNAPFDVGFLDAEFERVGKTWGAVVDYCVVIDTLPMARQLHPGQRNSLDALCRRYEIDNTHRELHGALLDAGLLAEVYLAMSGGQVDLSLESEQRAEAAVIAETGKTRGPLVTVSPTTAELAAHNQFLELIDQASADGCLWLSDDLPVLDSTN